MRVTWAMRTTVESLRGRVARRSSVAVVRRGDTGGAEVVGATCGQPRPLRDGPPVGPIDGAAVVVGTHLSGRGVEEPLRPALGGVLPGLLAAVDGHVEHRVGTAHQLAAAAGGPVCLEDSVIVAQVADPHPEMPAGDERIDRG